MDRLIAHLLLVLLGGTVLRVALTDAVLAYVQPGFRPLLVGAGAVLLLIGVVGFVLDRPRSAPTDEHAEATEEHDHIPPSSWLLVLPVAVLLLVAPPALGVFTVERQSQPLTAAVPEVLPAQQPDASQAQERQLVRSMSMLEYGQWAIADDPGPLRGAVVRLHGFVVPRGRGRLVHLPDPHQLLRRRRRPGLRGGEWGQGWRPGGGVGRGGRLVVPVGGPP